MKKYLKVGIDKIYKKHPIAWQAFVVSALLGMMTALFIFVWSNTTFGG